MPFRPTSYEYSEIADFSVKSVLGFNWAVTPAQYSIDGTFLGPVSDLASVRDVELEFKADDDNGSADPTEEKLRTAGGMPIARNLATGGILISTRPEVPFTRFVALRELLDAVGPSIGL